MKKISFLLALCMLGFILPANAQKLTDVVYLKNGSIVKGDIIEQIPNVSLKIETRDGNVFFYTMEEIEKLAKERLQGRDGSSSSNRGLQSGYRGIIEFGYQIGVGDFGMERLELNMINGGQINPYFSLGVGAGVRYYFNAKEGIGGEYGIAVPLFADVKINFVDDSISPYLSCGIGYSFDARDDFKGLGLYLKPTVGMSFKTSKKSALLIGVGYEIQKIKISDYEAINSGAISINIGISF